MKKTFTLLMNALACYMLAQQPAFTIGSLGTSLVNDNPEVSTFRIDKKNYVLYSKYHMSDGMSLRLEGFSDPSDEFFCSQDITVPHLPNEIALYEGFVALNNKMILFRSVYNKDSKKNVLFAHELNPKGMIIDAAGKEISSISSEKIMNAGNFIIKASADRASFVVLSEFPFVKETKEKCAVAVFDNSLKQLWSKEIEMLYDSRRGPQNVPMVSNSGIVYLIKKVEGPKNADFYSCYQISNKSALVKENILEMELPKKIVNYGGLIDEVSSDLCIAGYYTEDGKVTLGGTGFRGNYFFKISGGNGSLAIKTSYAFEKKQSNLSVNNLINIKGNFFLIGEEKYEESRSTEQKDSKGFPVYIKEFNANDIHVSVIDAQGKNIINSVFAKTNKSSEDGGFSNSLAASAVGEQLMLVYTDYQYKHDGQEHVVVGPMLANIKIPIIQFMGADGSTGKNFSLIDSNIGGKKGTIYLYPQIFIQLSTKEFFFLGNDRSNICPLRMKLP